MLASDKHSILLGIFLNYANKKIYNIGPMCQCYKTFLFLLFGQNKLRCWSLANFLASHTLPSDEYQYWTRARLSKGNLG